MDEPVQILSDRYELGPLLGSGGMADVRRARDRVLGRDVAVKLMRRGADVDRDRFVSEARVLARLSHDHVVTLLDAGVDDDLPWLVLELVEGETLADRLARGRVEVAELAAVGAAIARGLDHAHGRGVVHRDVKPSNVLLGRDRVRVTDFGIARLADATSALTLTGHTVGTAAYLAPEQVRGEAVTPATDAYALGLVLLEALTGERAYPGPPVEAALARLHHGPLLPVSLPAGWAALLATMTATDPADRPGAATVAARLTVLAGAPMPVPDQPSTAALAVGGNTHRRRPVTVALAAAAIAVAVAIAGWQVLSGDAPAAASADDAPSSPAPTPSPKTPSSTTTSRAPSPEPVVASSPTAAPVEKSTKPRKPAKATPTKPKRGKGLKPGKGHGKSHGKGKGKAKGKKHR